MLFLVYSVASTAIDCQPLENDGQALEAGIHEFLAELAGVFKRLRHDGDSFVDGVAHGQCALQPKYCAMHKKSIGLLTLGHWEAQRCGRRLTEEPAKKMNGAVTINRLVTLLA